MRKLRQRKEIELELQFAKKQDIIGQSVIRGLQETVKTNVKILFAKFIFNKAEDD